MPAESPHPHAPRTSDADARRNARMFDAVQGLSLQLDQTKRTLQEFVAALTEAGAADRAHPPTED